MNPIKMANATRTLGYNHLEFDPLDILDIELSEHRSVMVSFWQPSQKELENLTNGGAVELQVVGTVHPVVSLHVADRQKLYGDPQ